MKKMNKKGFTLIEMLVVIAIIAVLVAIIIPTVSSATTKAAAATDAANLRSILAEATTDYLANVENTEGYVSYTPAASATADPTFVVNGTAPVCKSDKTSKATISFNNGNLTVSYGSYDLNVYAYVAENGGTLAEAQTALGTTEETPVPSSSTGE